MTQGRNAVRRGVLRRFTDAEQEALAIAAEASGGSVDYLAQHTTAPKRRLRALVNDPDFQQRVEAIRAHRLHRADQFTAWCLLRMDDAQRVIDEDGLHSGDARVRLQTAWDIIRTVRAPLASEAAAGVNVLVKADAQLQQTLIQVAQQVVQLKITADAAPYDPATDTHLLRGVAALPSPVVAAAAVPVPDAPTPEPGAPVE